MPLGDDCIAAVLCVDGSRGAVWCDVHNGAAESGFSAEIMGRMRERKRNLPTEEHPSPRPKAAAAAAEKGRAGKYGLTSTEVGRDG